MTLEVTGKSISVDLYSRDGLEMLSNLWTKVAAENRIMYQPRWLGQPIIQFPNDIVAIQELIWTIQPDVIIETGVAHGGSLILSASILSILGRGKVIGVDIEIRPRNRAAIESHPLASMIHLIEGSSVALDVFEKVKKHCALGNKVIVFLDSNHSSAHVAKELELYHSLISPGSYIVVHDGAQEWVWEIPQGRSEWRNDHPLIAIREFLTGHPEFKSDPYWTRFGPTSSPEGFIKRLSEAEIKIK